MVVLKKVLICYYTATGSTKEAAEEIAVTLRDNGHGVTVIPITEVDSVNQYDAVIVGAPINGMMWRPEAKEFVRKHREELSVKKTAYFAMSYIYRIGRAFWAKRIEKAFDESSKNARPVLTGVFGGVSGNGKLPLLMTFIFGVPKNASNDQRQPEIVRAWAKRLSAMI